MKTQIPIYRAKKRNKNEYVEGCLSVQYFQNNYYYYIMEIDDEDQYAYDIDKSTLAIHFPNMAATDKKKTKIFASLQPDGKGGDLVEGYCRDCNGDKFEMFHRPVIIKGVVRFYDESVMGVVVETKDEIIISYRNNTPLVVKRGDSLRWSDCRQKIKVIGIQE